MGGGGGRDGDGDGDGGGVVKRTEAEEIGWNDTQTKIIASNQVQRIFAASRGGKRNSI